MNSALVGTEQNQSGIHFNPPEFSSDVRNILPEVIYRDDGNLNDSNVIGSLFRTSDYAKVYMKLVFKEKSCKESLYNKRNAHTRIQHHIKKRQIKNSF